MRKSFKAKKTPMVLMEGRIADLSTKQVLFEQTICRCVNWNGCICQPSKIWIPKSIIQRGKQAIAGDLNLWERGVARFKIPVWFFKKIQNTDA